MEGLSMSNKKPYKARVTKEVNMTKEEYREYLKERRDLYLRLVDDRNKALENYSARCYEKIREYNEEIAKIVKQIASLK
mgnify:CR=1 FL=1